MKVFSMTKGFTYMELIITFVILSVLAAIAIPSYQDYNRKMYFSEVIKATTPFKDAVGKCVQNKKSLKECNAGSNGIPAALTKPKGVISSLSIEKGIITVSPVAARGVQTSDVYILTPSLDAANGNVIWAASGVGVAHGYAK